MGYVYIISRNRTVRNPAKGKAYTESHYFSKSASVLETHTPSLTMDRRGQSRNMPNEHVIPVLLLAIVLMYIADVCAVDLFLCRAMFVDMYLENGREVFTHIWDTAICTEIT